MTRLRAFIVDDEPPARRRIAELLDTASDIEIAGEYDNGRDALEALRKAPPELLFLDVQMPELDGLGVIEELGPGNAPVTIFVTAFDRYALKAFDVHALDYLLKPFSDERFEEALDRARQALHSGSRDTLERKLEALLDGVASSRSAFSRRIPIKNAGRVCFLDVESIDWIEAAGVYVTLHTADEQHLLRESLTALESKLDPSRFARIHRSTIVSLDQVRELRADARGQYEVVLHDGTALKLSRTYRDKLERSMEHGQ